MQRDGGDNNNQPDRTMVTRGVIALLFIVCAPVVLFVWSSPPPIAYIIAIYFSICAIIQIVASFVPGSRLREWPIYLAYDLTGIKYLWFKIKRSSEPSTITFWFVGTYATFFALASSVYEAEASRITNRANAVSSQIASTKEKGIPLQSIPRIQNEKCPRKPSLLDPFSVFISLFGKQQTFQDHQDFLIVTVQSNRFDCAGLNLQGITGTSEKVTDYRGAIFETSDLTGSYFKEADFSEGNLKAADFENSDLRKAKFFATDIAETDFSRSNLSNADFGVLNENKTSSPPNVVKGWRTAKFQGANIYRINAPPELKEFARKEGAVEYDPEQWQEFKNNGYKKLASWEK